MQGFHIWSIAKYEIKTLTRSWFFRIFGILALVVLFFFNLVVQTDVGGSGDWDLTILPAGIPYRNLLILNMAQAIIAAFLASDFLRRDKKLDSTEVIYMRSMSNVDYVLGKTLGNLIVFIGLNLLVLLMVSIFNLISPTTGMDAMAYVQYLFYLSIPTLVFIMGLSFLLMSLIRNQGITFIMLLGYIALTVFYLKGKVFYLFDYMAYNVPMMKSDIAGFGRIQDVLIHRGMYFFLGLGFIFWTIVLLKRLPQSKPASSLAFILATVFMILGFYMGFMHVHKYTSKQKLRTSMVELNNRLSNEPVATVSSHHINFEHLGETYKAVSKMMLVNKVDTPIDPLIFSLNPGLIIEEISFDGQPVQFNREHHIITIQESLMPGDSMEYTISYNGRINEAACYLDMDDESRQELSNYYQSSYAFVQPEYVLLTPETNWYPTTGVSYSNTNPRWLHQDFTRFVLEVTTAYPLTVISQGLEETSQNGVRFQPKHPLPFMTLVMGQYEKLSMEADSVEFRLMYHPQHDYFMDVFPDLQDTIPAIISARLQDFERRVNLDYPFKRFSIVEVPIQFASFQHVWAGGFENVQPEIVLIPEMGTGVREANLAGNIRNFERGSRRGGASMTQKDYQIRALNNFCNLFTREQGQANFNFNRGNFQVEERANPYYIFSLVFNHVNYISSNELPILNRVLEAYLKSTFADMRTSFMRQFSGMSEDEMANMALQVNSFAELLNDPEQTQIIDNVIKLKGDVLFSNIKAIAGKEDFEDFLYAFLDEHKYQVTPFNEFANALEARFEIDLRQYISEWFNSRALPGFLFSSAVAENVRSENMVQTMVQFKVSNMEDIPGVVKIVFRFGGPGGRGGFGGPGMGGPGEDNSIEKLVYLEGQQTKEISYLLDQAPRAMTINTMTSKNIPMEIMNTFRRVEDNNRKTPFEGEVVVPDPVDLKMQNEIIIDNEDPEFEIIQPESKGFFVRLFSGPEDDDQKYSGFVRWRIPVNWTLTTNSQFYGRYVRSAYYARQGSGDRMARWNFPIPENGYYEVFYYMEQQQMRGGFGRGPGGDESERDAGQYQFIIHHDDGEETLTLDLNDIQGGWNSLGSFYFSPDTARIELSNQGEGEMVIADAVKLVKEDAY